MIRLIFLLVTLACGLFVGTQYSGHQGYVLISIANKTLEMSVTTLVILLIALLAGLFFLEYLFKKSIHYTSATWNWFGIRKLKRARRYTNEGIIKLIEGDWKTAEKRVTKWSNHHDMPLLCYLVASEAAHSQGRYLERDKYLNQASQQPDSQLAVGLTHARQQIDLQQHAQAFEQLMQLRNTYPSNAAILNLLKVSGIKLEFWEDLYRLLPKMKEAKVIDKQTQWQVVQHFHISQFSEIATRNNSEELTCYWSELPRKHKQNLELIVSFSQTLIALRADKEAYDILRKTINKTPDPKLFELLPSLYLDDTQIIIKDLKKYLQKQPDNGDAHSALGNIYAHQKEWEMAQKELEIALKLRVSIADYQLLTLALEKQNMLKAAHEVSLQALLLAQQ